MYITNHVLISLANYQSLLKVSSYKDPEHAVHFLLHVALGNLIRLSRQEPSACPVHNRLIRKTWGLTNTQLLWRDWTKLGLLTLDSEVPNQLSRRFHVSAQVLNLITEPFLPETLMVNGCTGKAVKCRLGHVKHDGHRNPYPEVLTRAMEAISPLSVNLEELIAYVKQQEGQPHYFNVRYALHTVCSRTQDGLYYPRYCPQSAGRITELGIGFQSCHNSMKALAFKDMYNYDIRSSHPNTLLTYMEQASLDTSWLEAYVDSDPSDWAMKVGMPRSEWKRLILAVIYGSSLLKGRKAKPNVAYDIVMNTGADLELVRQLLEPLFQLRTVWYKYLLETFIPNQCLVSLDYKFLRNRCDQKISLKKPPNELTAHLMQGLESAFIYCLTQDVKEVGIKVVSNQHDGLVTDRPIPDYLIQQAKEFVGFPRAQLTIKPFKENNPLTPIQQPTKK